MPEEQTLAMIAQQQQQSKENIPTNKNKTTNKVLHLLPTKEKLGTPSSRMAKHTTASQLITNTATGTPTRWKIVTLTKR